MSEYILNKSHFTHTQQLDINYKTALLDEFSQLILNNPDILTGDILEFGTGSGQCTIILGAMLAPKKLFTFDCFEGLPPTKKPIIDSWRAGNFRFDYDTVKTRFVGIDNIVVNKALITADSNPQTYGISKISGANMDFDLYEGTLNALRFCNKCVWSSILLRFDDWGAHDHQSPAVVDEHEKAALEDFVAETKYKYTMITCPNVKTSKHGPLCSIVHLKK